MQQFNFQDQQVSYQNNNNYINLSLANRFSSLNLFNNNNSKFLNSQGFMMNFENENSWGSQNSTSQSSYNNRSVNKENMRNRSRSRSQGRSQSRDRERRTYTGNQKFEHRQNGYRGFNQNNKWSRGKGSRSKSPGRYQNFGQKRFNQDRRFENCVLKPTLDGQLKSFDLFMDSQCIDVDCEEAEKVYERYLKDYEEKQDQIFFAEHKNDEWFKELYDPILVATISEEKIIEAQANANRFIEELEKGVYDSLNLNYEDYESTDIMNRYLLKSSSKMEEEKQTSNGSAEFSLDANINISGAPLHGLNTIPHMLLIKCIPSFISRWDLIEPLKKLNGYQSLSISEPNKEFNKSGSILFDNETNCNIAYEHLKTLNIKGYAFNIVKAKSQQQSVKVCGNVNSEKILTYVQLSRQLIETLDNEKDIKVNSSLKYAQEVDPAKQLDLQILYLRRVHSYCFYCAAEYSSESQLAAKCGSIHLRKQNAGVEESLPTQADWHQKISEAIRGRIQESASKSKLTKEEAVRKMEEEFDTELMTKHLKMSKQGNWPCKFCQKIFKEDHFVIKHIKTKHPEECQKLKERRYSSDKNRMTSSSDSTYRNKSFEQEDKQGKKQYRQKYNSKDFEYQDLDDPSCYQTKPIGPIIDYADL